MYHIINKYCALLYTAAIPYFFIMEIEIIQQAPKKWQTEVDEK